MRDRLTATQSGLVFAQKRAQHPIFGAEHEFTRNVCVACLHFLCVKLLVPWNTYVYICKYIYVYIYTHI